MRLPVRSLGLLVAIAHLGVATIPCSEGASSTAEPVAPVAVAVVAVNAHHGHHAQQAPHAHHGQANHQAMRSEHEAGGLVLTAPCLCGCDKSGTGVTPSARPRVGFALFPPKPVQLVESAPPRYPGTPGVMPDGLPHLLDHVPIPS